VDSLPSRLTGALIPRSWYAEPPRAGLSQKHSIS
jgi:hypothetical protein